MRISRKKTVTYCNKQIRLRKRWLEAKDNQGKFAFSLISRCMYEEEIAIYKYVLRGLK